MSKLLEVLYLYAMENLSRTFLTKYHPEYNKTASYCDKKLESLKKELSKEHMTILQLYLDYSEETALCECNAAFLSGLSIGLSLNAVTP